MLVLHTRIDEAAEESAPGSESDDGVTVLMADCQRLASHCPERCPITDESGRMMCFWVREGDCK
jgi:hypothetical protein